MFPIVTLGNRIYILGGVANGRGAIASLLVSTNNGTDWEETTSLRTARYGHTAVSTETLDCN